MEYRRTKDNIFLRIDRDEPIRQTIEQVCAKEGVRAAAVDGIGACDEITLSVYYPKENVYRPHVFKGTLEIVSLTGNVTTDEEGKPLSHIHLSFSYIDDDGRLAYTGGHLDEARISYTGELVLHVADFPIRRQFEPVRQIKIWDFDGND